MKALTFFKLSVLIVICMFLAASCVKEGPMGPAGADGKDGVNGINGTDGTATCSQCHSDNQEIYGKEIQYAISQHANGLNYNKNTGECATCHTSQGFRGKLDGTYDWTSDDSQITDPNPQNCYTCHKIHETYTINDLQLTVNGPIELRNTGGKTHDYGKGDVCASCHQGRTVDPFPVAGGDSIEVTSSHYGLHHGPQANFIAGVGMGLFEVGTGLVNSAHSTNNPDACVTCHMAEYIPGYAGGHTLWITYTDSRGRERINSAGCYTSGCHQEGEDMFALMEDYQSEIQALMDELKTKLDAAGITNPGSDSSNKAKFSALVAGAYLDYYAFEEDRSFGVHNPKYAKKLLENLIDALN